MSEDEAYKKVCQRIVALATTASLFPRSGAAASGMDNIIAEARKAHAISGHRIGIGVTFMDYPEANVYRFREPVQLEEGGLTVAFVRGRNSPFLPKVLP